VPAKPPAKKAAKKPASISARTPTTKPAKASNPAASKAKPSGDRARELARVRAVVKRHLPRGYKEAKRGRMLVWEVPLSVYPDTYNGHALWYAALAEQKNYLTLHLMGV